MMGRCKEGLDEEEHAVFSDTWNQIIEDLRDADLISNKERGYLIYSKLEWHHSFLEHKIKPLIPPVFVFAGQVSMSRLPVNPSMSRLDLGMNT